MAGPAPLGSGFCCTSLSSGSLLQSHPNGWAEGARHQQCLKTPKVFPYAPVWEPLAKWLQAQTAATSLGLTPHSTPAVWPRANCWNLLRLHFLIYKMQYFKNSASVYLKVFPRGLNGVLVAKCLLQLPIPAKICKSLLKRKTHASLFLPRAFAPTLAEPNPPWLSWR